MILTENRRHTFLPLAEVRFPDVALDRLAALGVSTVEELRDLWTYGNRETLFAYLGESPLRLVAFAPPAGAPHVAAVGSGPSVNLFAVGRTPPLVRHPRGVVLTPTQRRHVALSPTPVAAVASQNVKTVTLQSRFPAVRDQGHRATCVAFAAVAILEYYQYGTAKPQRHAEQMVYWACKEVDGLPNIEGTYVRVARGVLRTVGACKARTWPYQPLPVGPTEGQGPPPQGAPEEAAEFLCPRVRKVAASDVLRLRELLDEERPVVLSVKTFGSWDYPSVVETGEITMPLPGNHPDGAHAVCLVGYELRDEVPGGGGFIFRNSWGRDWGRRRGRFGEGYGSLFFDYVKKYALEAFA